MSAISSSSDLAGVEVLDPQRVALVALDVDGVGEQRAVGADLERAEREELVALGLDVAVEQHLLALGRRRSASSIGRSSRRDRRGHRHWMPYCWPSKVRA